MKTTVKNGLLKNPYVQLIGVLLAAIVAYRMYSGLKKGGQAMKNLAQDIAQDAQIKQLDNAFSQNNVPAVDSARIINTAEKIYQALHKDSLFGWGEDEEKAVNAFNSLTSVGEAKACASIYQTNYEKNLFEDLKKYVHGTDWNRLKSFLLNAIK